MLALLAIRLAEDLKEDTIAAECRGLLFTKGSSLVLILANPRKSGTKVILVHTERVLGD